MITFTFATIATINAILLIALLAVIRFKLKATAEQEIDTLEKWQDILVLSLLIGIVVVIFLSIFIIL